MVFVVGPTGTTGPSQAISSHSGHCNDFLPHSPQGPSDLPVRLATASGVILVDFLVSGSRTFEGLCQLWAQGRAALCLCQGLCALARGSCSFLCLPSWGLGPWPFMHNHLFPTPGYQLLSSHTKPMPAPGPWYQLYSQFEPYCHQFLPST